MSMDVDEFMGDNNTEEPTFNNSNIFNYNANFMNNDGTMNTKPVIDNSIAMILCPLCQTPIEPNAVNLCLQCLNSQVDISEGITKQIVIFQCRQCDRWYKNPQWVEAIAESPQLLALLLKKVRGLGKVKLVDASFIWTEPHSKRLKIKLVIQKEVMNNAIVEKSFPIEFIIQNQQCTECKASFTHHIWRASIQLRQKVTHKRTFLFLEQLILKHHMTNQVLGMTEYKDGIDFFFVNRAHAQNFLAFLHTTAPIESKQSKRLVSADLKSNTQKFKYSWFAEIAQICRSDLVVIPPGKLRNKCGGCLPLMLCYKVSASLHFVDVTTLHTIELDGHQYFRSNFGSLANTQDLTQFFVMSVNVLSGQSRKGKWQLAEVECVKENEIGDDNAKVYETVTHIGALIKEGDIVLAYDLHTLNSVNSDILNDKSLRKFKIPDCIIVRKHYIKRHRKRKWTLKSMAKDKAYEMDSQMERRENADMEEFMRELEEDFDMRCRINLFKKSKANKAEGDASSVASSNLDDRDPDVAPSVPLNELLDDFGEMKLETLDENQTMTADNNNNNQTQNNTQFQNNQFNSDFNNDGGNFNNNDNDGNNNNNDNNNDNGNDEAAVEEFIDID